MQDSLRRCQPVIEAEDMLAQAGEIPDGQLYDVVLAATGDEDAAELALRRRIGARLERGERPQV